MEEKSRLRSGWFDDLAQALDPTHLGKVLKLNLDATQDMEARRRSCKKTHMHELAKLQPWTVVYRKL